MARPCAFITALWVSLSTLSRQAMAIRSRPTPEGYSFAQFVKDYRRTYLPGTEEYRKREAFFQASVKEVHATNARNAREGRSWAAGVHPFMDWAPAERKALNGYKPSQRHSGRRPAGAMALLHQGAQGRAAGRLNTTGGLSLSDMGPVVRQQGSCGSCWAISAVSCVEAHLQRNGAAGPETRLSAQALVDCVPNPQHCGGSGGCDGATGELAYTFMRDHGIPLESDLPYTARTAACPEQPLDGAWRTARRARVSGWSALPSNQAQPLMDALVQRGPVVVAVDGNEWFNYDRGVFDSCAKDAILGHAVLAKGYGEDNGNKYWLIQNSWGSDWGESGHIRLLMHENEDNWCGTDSKPQEGLGCDGGPPEITVCGACGILYDPIVPEGVRLEEEGNDAFSPPMPADAESRAIATTVPAPSDEKAKQSPAQEMQELLREYKTAQ